jgi:hypothetical protein
MKNEASTSPDLQRSAALNSDQLPSREGLCILTDHLSNNFGQLAWLRIKGALAIGPGNLVTGAGAFSSTLPFK